MKRHEYRKMKTQLAPPCPRLQAKSMVLNHEFRLKGVAGGACRPKPTQKWQDLETNGTAEAPRLGN